MVLSSLEGDILILLENMRTFSYELNENDRILNTQTEGFAHGFKDALDTVMVQYEKHLTHSNFEELAQEAVNILTNELEAIMFKRRFNRLGGLQFDRDIRTLMNYFTEKTQRTRDKFARLTRMSFLLKLNRLEDVLDYWDSEASVTWRMTSTEVKNVLMLRTDFSNNTVKSLKLE
jgi:hypothetical protein